MGKRLLLLLIMWMLGCASSGCALAEDDQDEEEEVDAEESPLTQKYLAMTVPAPAPDASNPITETVARSVRKGIRPAIYVEGGKAKAKPRPILAVNLGTVGSERLHLLANVALSRCNKDDVTGNGGPGSPCRYMRGNWGAQSYPYQPKVSAYFQFSNGKGGTKKVGKATTFTCTEGAHHCPLELAADVAPNPAMPIVELVVEAEDPSGRAKNGDLVELEIDDAKTGRSKSSLHAFRIALGGGPAPGLVSKPKASAGCMTSALEVKSSKNANGSTPIVLQTVHVNPATTYLEIAAFADIQEQKKGGIVEPLVNSQIVMRSSHGRVELSPRSGLNCTGGTCKVARYGSLRVKPGFFGDEDVTITYEVGAVRTQENHDGKPIKGTQYVLPKACAMNVNTLRP